MKAHYRPHGGRLSIEIEGATIKQLFRSIAEVQEIFDADEVCQCCQSPNIQFRVRENDSFTFYELHCEDCYGKLEYGQSKTGEKLWPKRFEDGKPLPNRGWKVRYAVAPNPKPAEATAK